MKGQILKVTLHLKKVRSRVNAKVPDEVELSELTIKHPSCKKSWLEVQFERKDTKQFNKPITYKHSVISASDLLNLYQIVKAVHGPVTGTTVYEMECYEAAADSVSESKPPIIEENW